MNRRPGFLGRDLAREQKAFLRRDRSRWDEHLARIRAFLGEGLQTAGLGGSALILGAGSGLEVPWALAGPGTVGWDADPWSRWRTALRHRRWPPWVFADLTGGLEALADLAWRATHHPGSARVREGAVARRRLAGLLPELDPQARPLAAWIREHRPGTILAANVMGQFGVVARRAVERAFQGVWPWTADPELPDPLAEAVDAWTARAIGSFLAVLADSGADLWLVHDRGVLFGDVPVTLGPMADSWVDQLRGRGDLEASDPLCGVQVLQACRGRAGTRCARWIWPVAEGQTHVMEALRFPPSKVDS
jgi:hypothetical protein